MTLQITFNLYCDLSNLRRRVRKNMRKRKKRRRKMGKWKRTTRRNGKRTRRRKGKNRRRRRRRKGRTRGVGRAKGGAGVFIASNLLENIILPCCNLSFVFGYNLRATEVRIGREYLISHRWIIDTVIYCNFSIAAACKMDFLQIIVIRIWQTCVQNSEGQN